MAAISLSRNREFLADASAVEFTRNPAAPIRVLEHIAKVRRPFALEFGARVGGPVRDLGVKTGILVGGVASKSPRPIEGRSRHAAMVKRFVPCFVLC